MTKKKSSSAFSWEVCEKHVYKSCVTKGYYIMFVGIPLKPCLLYQPRSRFPPAQNILSVVRTSAEIMSLCVLSHRLLTVRCDTLYLTKICFWGIFLSDNMLHSVGHKSKGNGDCNGGWKELQEYAITRGCFHWTPLVKWYVYAVLLDIFVYMLDHLMWDAHHVWIWYFQRSPLRYQPEKPSEDQSVEESIKPSVLPHHGLWWFQPRGPQRGLRGAYCVGSRQTQQPLHWGY